MQPAKCIHYFEVSNDHLEMGKPLPDAKGKFADLKLATLHTGAGKRTVVAKMNKGIFIGITAIATKLIFTFSILVCLTNCFKIFK